MIINIIFAADKDNIHKIVGSNISLENSTLLAFPFSIVQKNRGLKLCLYIDFIQTDVIQDQGMHL